MSNESSGIGFTSLLTLLFIGLKLGGVIAWSWFFVLSPLWVPVGFTLVVLLIIGIMKLME